MPKTKRWTDDQLSSAIEGSNSYRSVLILLGLVPAGGNYEQVKKRAKELGFSTEHFTGRGWNKGKKYSLKSAVPVQELLIENGNVQSFKLKNKLFIAGLKKPKCEICGWCQKSIDGRIPVELDHINGNRYDNRIENLRILCPNCHSLQSTHRGKNKKTALQNRNF
jgi:hypothetical protein